METILSLVSKAGGAVTSLIANIRQILIALALGLVIGLLCGWHAQTIWDNHKEVKVAREAQEDTADNIVESNEDSAEIEGEVTDKIEPVERIREVFRTKKEYVYLPSPTVTTGNENAPVSATCFAFTLDDVRLLNDARRAVDSAPSSDAALQAPAALEGKEFIDNDLQIVKLYHELAIRHDALVDAVEEKLKKQAK